jgi:beta-mannosidase
MQKRTFTWQVGYMQTACAQPEEMIPATVPGAAQLDYARAHNWPPVEEGVNFRDYAWMEDVYWLYTAPLDFTLEEDEVATLRFLGIDYRYRIQVGNQILAEGEGMFSPVFCDVTPFAGQTLEVLLWPVPKATDSNNRIQARKSCKAAACYGWDWHPRLVSSGLWDAVTLQIQPRQSLWNLDVSYRLSDQLDCCQLHVTAAVHGDCRVNLQLLDGEELLRKKPRLPAAKPPLFPFPFLSPSCGIPWASASLPCTICPLP